LNSHFILPASLPQGISPLKIPFSFLNTKKIHVKKESLFFLKNKNSVPNRTATAKIAKLPARLKYFRFGNCLNCRFQE
jgi:hypothetical protein